MPSPSSLTGERATRIKLLGTVLAIVEVSHGQRLRGRINQMSANGGVLHLSEPLDEAAQVWLMFHVASTTVRAQAEMMAPIWATKGCLQPFRFRNLSHEQREQLDAEIRSLAGNAVTSSFES